MRETCWTQRAHITQIMELCDSCYDKFEVEAHDPIYSEEDKFVCGAQQDDRFTSTISVMLVGFTSIGRKQIPSCMHEAPARRGESGPLDVQQSKYFMSLRNLIPSCVQESPTCRKEPLFTSNGADESNNLLSVRRSTNNPCAYFTLLCLQFSKHQYNLLNSMHKYN